MRIIAVIFIFLLMLQNAISTVALAQQPLASTIVANTIPEIMEAGKSYSVSITVKNTGTETWTAANGFKLGAVGDSDLFAAGRHLIRNDQTVPANQVYTFQFIMTAPGTPGTYISDWRMVKEAVAWFGDKIEKSITVVNPTRSQISLYDVSDRLQTTDLPTDHRLDNLYDANGNLLSKQLTNNLLVNGDFENGSANWLLNPPMSMASGISKSGRSSIKFSAATPVAGVVSRTPHFIVKPNTTYTLTGWFLDHLSAGALYVDLMEFDAAGQVITSKGIRPMRGARQWEYKTLTLQTQPNTVQAVVRVVADSGAAGTGYVDDIQLYSGVANPGFENGGAGWTLGASMSVSSAQKKDGLQSVRFYSQTPVVGTTASTKPISVMPNRKYALSGWLMNNLTAGAWSVDWLEYDASGRIVLDGGTLWPTNRGQSTWDFSSIAFTTQPSTVYIIIRVVADNGAIGEGYADRIAFYPVDTPNLLKDGNWESHPHSWTNNPHMSVQQAEKREGSSSLRFFSATPIGGTAMNSTTVPVMPNTTYTLSGWFLNRLTAGSFYVDYFLFDQQGNLLLDGGGIGMLQGSGQWGYKSLAFTTSATTVHVQIRVVADLGAIGEGFVDDIQLHRSIANPNFESGSLGWTLSSNMSISTVQKKDGVQSIRFASTTPIAGTAASSYLIPVIPNTKYALSGWIMDNLTAGSFSVDWLEYDGANGLVLDGGTLYPSNRGTNYWSHSRVEFVTKPATTQIAVRIVADNGAMGEGFADGILLERP